MFLTNSIYTTLDSDDEHDQPNTVKGPSIGLILGINTPTLTDDSLYYCKYTNEAYINCHWLTRNQIFELGHSHLVFQRFMEVLKRDKLEKVGFIENLYKPSSYEFDRSYITPEKVAACRINGNYREYFIKWAGFHYDEATWEPQAPRELIEQWVKDNRIQVPAHTIFTRGTDPRRPTEIPKFSESMEYKNGHKLTSYQVDGLNWLLFCWHNHRNSILADEMGLGKTIQSISLIHCLQKLNGLQGPFLVVAPLSTISNWIYEFEEWTDFKVIALTGNGACRKNIKENCIFHQHKNGAIDTSSLKVNVIITSYEIIGIELNFIRSIKWLYAIFDEGHRLKSPTANVFKNCSQLKMDHILLMTGTPIQNCVNELWSILHFIHPHEFDNLDRFLAEYGDIKDQTKLDKLQQLITPYLLRRKKADVELSIKGKEETIIQVELTQVQRTIYRTILDDNREFLLENLTRNRQNLNHIMMQLRKICNHPYLLPGLEEMCISQYRVNKNLPNSEVISREEEFGALTSASGKMILIDKLLPKLKADGHKVLIFSQMTKVLDIIEDYLVYMQYSYERLDGSKSIDNRSLSIDRFSNDENSFVFLLSTRAGGLGINLTAADTVIIYDSDWNPQNDLQAQARCHRIGQTKDVKVYRLITRGTYEAEMFQRASKKLALDYALLDSKGTEELEEDESKEIEMILRKGAYYTFVEECDELDKFCEENIDQILEHRSQSATKDYVTGGNSKFAKVQFTGGQEAQIDFEDKEFWKQLLPGLKNTGKRNRKKTRHVMDFDYNYQEKKEKAKEEKKKEKLKEKGDKFKSNEDEDDDYINENVSDEESQGSVDTLPLSQEDNYEPEIPKKKKSRSKHQSSRYIIENDRVPRRKEMIFQKNQVEGIYEILTKYGIKGLSSRYNSSSMMYSFIAKAMLYHIYKTLTLEKQQVYEDYIAQATEDPVHQLKINEIIESPTFTDTDIIKDLVKGRSEDVILGIMLADRIFTVEVFLSQHLYPDHEIGCSMSVPTYWTLSEDYALLFHFICNGLDSDKLLCDPSSQFMQFIQSHVIKPGLQWLLSRVKMITYEYEAIIPPNFTTLNKGIDRPELFKERMKQMTYISHNRQKQLLRALYNFGFPYNQQREGVWGQIKIASKLTAFTFASIKDCTCAIINKCAEYYPSLEGICPPSKDYDASWIPEDILIFLGDQLDFFQDLRNETAYKKEIPPSIPRWEKSPNYWGAVNDQKLLHVIAQRGFTSLSCVANQLGLLPKGYDFSIYKNLELDNVKYSGSLSRYPQLKFLSDIEELKSRMRFALNYVQPSSPTSSNDSINLSLPLSIIIPNQEKEVETSLTEEQQIQFRKIQETEALLKKLQEKHLKEKSNKVAVFKLPQNSPSNVPDTNNKSKSVIYVSTSSEDESEPPGSAPNKKQANMESPINVIKPPPAPMRTYTDIRTKVLRPDYGQEVMINNKIRINNSLFNITLSQYPQSPHFELKCQEFNDIHVSGETLELTYNHFMRMFKNYIIPYTGNFSIPNVYDFFRLHPSFGLGPNIVGQLPLS